MRKTYDVIVVGGGVGGLTTGALLSNANLKVLLIEKREMVGGRLAPTLFKGSLIDFGPHIFWGVNAPNGVGNVLKELGFNFEWTPLEPLKVHIDDTTFVVDPRLFKLRKWKKLVPKGALSKEEMKELEGIIKSVLRANPERLDNISVKEWIEKKTDNKKVFRFVECMASLPLTVDDLALLSMGDLVRALRSFLKLKQTPVYPKKGINTIIESLKSTIEENNGRILTNHEVIKIMTKSGKTSGVLVKSLESNKIFKIKSEFVVADILLKDILRLVDKAAISPEIYRRIYELSPKTTAGISLTVGLKKKIFEYKGPVLYSKPDHVRYLFSPTNITNEKPYLFYGHYIEPDEYKNREDFLKATKKLIKEFLELFPDANGNIDWLMSGKIRTIDGLSRHTNQTGKFRPKVDLLNVKGLYFVGDSFEGKGNGVTTAVDSAKIVVDKILKAT